MRFKLPLTLLALVSLMIPLAGCENSVAGPTIPDVTGTWDLAVTTTGGSFGAGASFNLLVELTQLRGSLVRGTAANGSQPDSLIEGSFDADGRTLRFTVEQRGECPGLFTGAALVAGDGRSLSGGYDGSDCDTVLRTSLTGTKR